MIRFGIVGISGFAATWLHSLETLAAQGIATLTAAAERDRGAHAATVEALRVRGCTVYGALHEMLAAEGDRIDVVGLPVGIPEHAHLAIEALQAGYPVLVEKPVAATVQEVEAMAEAARRADRWCAVDYQWIYSPTIQWLRERLGGERLGALREARSTIAWPRAASYYARNGWAGRVTVDERWVLDGPATNATAHYMTNMLYLAGAHFGGDRGIARVRAELYHAKSIASYDTSCIEVVLANGARLLHYASHAVDESIEPVMDIFCEGGRAHWESATDGAEIWYDDGGHECLAGAPAAQIHLLPFQQSARVVEGVEPRPLCGLAEAAPHVLAINLAFESSGGIHAIPAAYITREAWTDGSPLVAVAHLADQLREAHDRGQLFSDMGLPWACASRPVEARGYVAFPSPGLGEVLGRLPKS